MKRNIILYIVGICSILIGCGEYPGPHTFAPNVLNGEVYNIYRYGATVDGVFIKPDTDAGSVKRCGILLSLYPSMAEADTIESGTIESGNKFTLWLKNLNSDTHYYYQTFAANDFSFLASEKVNEFQTYKECPPVFDRIRIEEQDCKSLVLSVPMIDKGTDGGLFSKGFCYKLATSENDLPYEDRDSKDIQIIETGNPQEIKARITNLRPGREYVIRPYGINSVDIGYGPALFISMEKTTIPIMSTVTALPYGNTPTVQAEAWLLAAGESAIAEMGFCWDINDTPTVQGLHKSVPFKDENEPIVSLIDLKPNTTYYMCAYAINVNGQAGYGEVCSIRLDGEYELALSDIIIEDCTTHSFSVSSSILSPGAGKDVVIEGQGFCYSDVTTPVVNGNNTVTVPVDDVVDGVFSTKVNNLVPATEYAIRAYLQTSGGIIYSNTATVRTQEDPKPDGDINDWEDKGEEGGILE
ncbi:MAG: hypothetical protein EGR83_19620 [Bacteroides cellulosilyticus]|nr:hypothetical protein [Bacteroides cellulosilyticus]